MTYGQFLYEFGQLQIRMVSTLEVCVWRRPGGSLTWKVDSKSDGCAYQRLEGAIGTILVPSPGEEGVLPKSAQWLRIYIHIHQRVHFCNLSYRSIHLKPSAIFPARVLWKIQCAYFVTNTQDRSLCLSWNLSSFLQDDSHRKCFLMSERSCAVWSNVPSCRHRMCLDKRRHASFSHVPTLINKYPNTTIQIVTVVPVAVFPLQRM